MGGAARGELPPQARRDVADLEAEIADARKKKQHADAARLQLDQKLAQANALHQAATSQNAQLEARARQQEQEILKLIQAKDAFSSQQGLKDDELSELNDNLYDATTKLEEEEERSRELQAEAEKLRTEAAASRQSAQKNAAALKAAQQELEDERERAERAENLLSKTTGGK